MCTVLLPPGINPIAVNKYIKYHILIQFHENPSVRSLAIPYGHTYRHDESNGRPSQAGEETVRTGPNLDCTDYRSLKFSFFISTHVLEYNLKIGHDILLT